MGITTPTHPALPAACHDFPSPPPAGHLSQLYSYPHHQHPHIPAHNFLPTQSFMSTCAPSQMHYSPHHHQQYQQPKSILRNPRSSSSSLTLSTPTTSLLPKQAHRVSFAPDTKPDRSSAILPVLGNHFDHNQQQTQHQGNSTTPTTTIMAYHHQQRQICRHNANNNDTRIKPRSGQTGSYLFMLHTPLKGHVAKPRSMRR